MPKSLRRNDVSTIDRSVGGKGSGNGWPLAPPPPPNDKLRHTLRARTNGIARPPRSNVYKYMYTSSVYVPVTRLQNDNRDGVVRYSRQEFFHVFVPSEVYNLRVLSVEFGNYAPTPSTNGTPFNDSLPRVRARSNRRSIYVKRRFRFRFYNSTSFYRFNGFRMIRYHTILLDIY